jgi:glycosyltransferase involved in cell wall biosynthesis
VPNTLVIFSQVFIPDPASVGQHVADVAREMARRGYRVIVYASDRGYENPSLRYPAREVIDGVLVRRLPLSSFGKKNILTRLIGTASFHLQAFIRGLFTRRPDGIVFSTSPPLIGVAGALVGLLRRVPVVYWAMDLNPDQLLALGKIKSNSLIARFLERANRFILRRSAMIVALERFMVDRLERRRGLRLGEKLRTIAPWPHENHIEPVDQSTNPFRLRHDLAGKFVVMYSGNHSPSNPLSTLLQATLAFRNDPRVRFLFVGGGLAKRDIEQFARQQQLANVICLPYQPLADLRYSLSAADVHVVSLGEAMTGIIHPCKIYGAMAVGRPILYFGPAPSHVSDLLQEHQIGWHVTHGDVDGAVEAIRAAALAPPAMLQAMGRRAAETLAAQFTQARLCGQFCDELTRILQRQITPSSRSPHATLSIARPADS